MSKKLKLKYQQFISIVYWLIINKLTRSMRRIYYTYNFILLVCGLNFKEICQRLWCKILIYCNVNKLYFINKYSKNLKISSFPFPYLILILVFKNSPLFNVVCLYLCFVTIITSLVRHCHVFIYPSLGLPL